MNARIHILVELVVVRVRVRVRVRARVGVGFRVRVRVRVRVGIPGTFGESRAGGNRCRYDWCQGCVGGCIHRTRISGIRAACIGGG